MFEKKKKGMTLEVDEKMAYYVVMSTLLFKIFN